jgi:hypothetical protein
MSQKKWVYLFDEVQLAEQYVGGDWEGVRALLGGKGAGLADMTRAGVPVPPGFTVTTEACNAYQANGKFPQGMWEQELEALKDVEKKTGKNFGDPKNPLLVSCRSGAKFSMPGMMDTVLNLGLTDVTAEGMIKLTGNPVLCGLAAGGMFNTVVLGSQTRPSSSRCGTRPRKATAGYRDDGRGLEGHHRGIPGRGQKRRLRFPAGPVEAARAGYRSSLQILERQAGGGLPPRYQYPR